MGAWGTGSFENDDASDWIWELEDAKDTAVLEAALRSVIECEEYLERPECSNAVAAAEVVAALGKQGVELPEEAAAYVKKMKSPPAPALVKLAIQAVARVKTDSELAELWAESDDAKEWRTVLEDLEKRLKSLQ